MEIIEISQVNDYLAEMIDMREFEYFLFKNFDAGGKEGKREIINFKPKKSKRKTLGIVGIPRVYCEGCTLRTLSSQTDLSQWGVEPTPLLP